MLIALHKMGIKLYPERKTCSIRNMYKLLYHELLKHDLVIFMFSVHFLSNAFKIVSTDLTLLGLILL